MTNKTGGVMIQISGKKAGDAGAKRHRVFSSGQSPQPSPCPNSSGNSSSVNFPSVNSAPKEACFASKNIRQADSSGASVAESSFIESYISTSAHSNRSYVTQERGQSFQRISDSSSGFRKHVKKKNTSSAGSFPGLYLFVIVSFLTAVIAISVSVSPYFKEGNPKGPGAAVLPGNDAGINKEFQFKQIQAVVEDLIKKMEKRVRTPADSVEGRFVLALEKLRSELEMVIKGHKVSVDNQLAHMNEQLHEFEESLKSFNKELAFGNAMSKKADNSKEKANDVMRDIYATISDFKSTITEMVQSEIKKHSADGIGKVDYALSSGGGKVLGHSEVYDPGNLFLSFKFGSSTHPLANEILKPKFGEPGRCLPLKGSDVYVIIGLRTSIFPEAVTLEHLPKSVAYDMSSAVKEFKVYGTDSAPEAWEQSWNLLGEFTYSATDDKSIQTFTLSNGIAGTTKINEVKFHVLSNHGSPSHTCIYRVRVHGHE